MTVPAAQHEPTATTSLRYDSTVPRALVHRAAVAEVFLTDSRRSPGRPDTFEVAAQLPRAHIMGESALAHDFLLLVEILRQSGVFIAHEYENVPLDDAFIFRGLRTWLSDLDAIRAQDRPAEAVVTLTCAPQRKRNGRVQALDFDGHVSIDGRRAIRLDGGLAFFSRSVYKALRARHRAALDAETGPLPTYARAQPGEVGRVNPYNVVITKPLPAGGSALSATVIADQSHPHLFDHRLDHIPGNLLLEAARQLACASVATLHSIAADTLQVVSLDADFREFAELDLVSRAVATVEQFRVDETLGTLVVPVVVDVAQRGHTVASFRLEVAQ
ncbi:ScbA/BarX family gamma-butyrolactone biosynthesis protein [Streptomyces sp. VRA16 Mangrove soil]|uniref:ScbA/BarX family gamma-butyrolactone biosynthesis protein n=1 Tax=Streptomyces sp. VRA16 Mangrove soil TaxID=2817434 RepID=UPI001A9D6DAF|nr:ScbA/BarX family gamma-butyrolactone biosynthesis protein [Streptomyces sp. VRA16 Mangrove soil]MBO1334256.1 secondary metabolite corepressor [Streptomyces sp. VRA16 Mangrove soil]